MSARASWSNLSSGFPTYVCLHSACFFYARSYAQLASMQQPSTVCRIMDGVYTHCRSRGADGFAFVVHNMGSTELGNSGMGLGYDQINNSLAVEFDTFFNAENLDQYENAVSVHTRGSRYPNSANEVGCYLRRGV